MIENKENIKEQNNPLLPDLTDVEEARRAFIASEILNRKW